MRMRELRTRPGTQLLALRAAELPVLSLLQHQNSVFTQFKVMVTPVLLWPPRAAMVTKYYSPARPVATTAQLGKLLSKLMANLTKWADLNVNRTKSGAVS